MGPHEGRGILFVPYFVQLLAPNVDGVLNFLLRDFENFQKNRFSKYYIQFLITLCNSVSNLAPFVG